MVPDPLPTIYSNLEILGREPSFAGLALLFKHCWIISRMASGKEGFEEFLLDFPTVTREQALAALTENSKLHLLK